MVPGLGSHCLRSGRSLWKLRYCFQWIDHLSRCYYFFFPSILTSTPWPSRSFSFHWPFMVGLIFIVIFAISVSFTLVVALHIFHRWHRYISFTFGKIVSIRRYNFRLRRKPYVPVLLFLNAEGTFVFITISIFDLAIAFSVVVNPLTDVGIPF